MKINRLNNSMNMPSVNTNNAIYSKTLSQKFDYLNKTAKMNGVPVTVNVSPAFIRKCCNDPDKAKYLEENLSVIPDCVNSLCKSVSSAPGSPVVTYATYNIDENGNISCVSGSTNDPDGKIARENAEKKAKEKNAKQRQNITDYKAKMKKIIEEQRKRPKPGDTVRTKNLEKIEPDTSLEKAYIEKFEALSEKLKAGDFFNGKA